MTADIATGTTPVLDDKKVLYNRVLLIVAGLGGLLYGIDVGIIAGALPYLEATSGFSGGQLSEVVAAVLLGSVISTLFAGLLADWMGRKSLMAVSGLMFVTSIPMIALSQGFSSLIVGRLLQGISGGLIGVVIPLYLAECLTASNRGKGTGIFQWLLTLGLVIAAALGLYFSFRVDQVAKLGDVAQLLKFKDHAWRSIFWVSLPPGILFVMGSLMVAESPRWLLRRGKKDAAYAALLRSRTTEQADLELREMQETTAAERTSTASARQGAKESLLRRKYVIPFILACIILACNQATGINSIIGYNTNILLQSGLSDFAAHWGYLVFQIINFSVTFLGVMLVDRKGRKFLLAVGTGGIIISLIGTGILFLGNEKHRVDARSTVQARVSGDQKLTLTYSGAVADQLLKESGNPGINAPTSLVVIYSYGDFRATSQVVRSNDAATKPIEITRGILPDNKIVAFFSNPLGNLAASRRAPLTIEKALISPVPDASNGWLVATTLFIFMAFYAVGPGVCVWLALSELMPTRIRSNGMSIALVLNQAVSTTIAAVFLPTVGKYGYSTMFFGFAACTVIYFVTAAFFLPETKGKTLEEIEAHFEGAGEKS